MHAISIGDEFTEEEDVEKVDKVVNSISVQSNTLGESACTSQGKTCAQRLMVYTIWFVTENVYRVV